MVLKEAYCFTWSRKEEKYLCESFATKNRKMTDRARVLESPVTVIFLLSSTNLKSRRSWGQPDWVVFDNVGDLLWGEQLPKARLSIALPKFNIHATQGINWLSREWWLTSTITVNVREKGAKDSQAYLERILNQNDSAAKQTRVMYSRRVYGDPAADQIVRGPSGGCRGDFISTPDSGYYRVFYKSFLAGNLRFGGCCEKPRL